MAKKKKSQKGWQEKGCATESRQKKGNQEENQKGC